MHNGKAERRGLAAGRAAIVCLLALSLTACGGSAGNGADTQGASAGAASESPTASGPTPLSEAFAQGGLWYEVDTDGDDSYGKDSYITDIYDFDADGTVKAVVGDFGRLGDLKAKSDEEIRAYCDDKLTQQKEAIENSSDGRYSSEKDRNQDLAAVEDKIERWAEKRHYVVAIDTDSTGNATESESFYYSYDDSHYPDVIQVADLTSDKYPDRLTTFQVYDATYTGYCNGEDKCLVTRAERFPQGLTLDQPSTDNPDILVDTDSDDVKAKLGITDSTANAAN